MLESGAKNKMQRRKNTSVVQCTCLNCNNVFKSTQYRIDDGRGKFCSKECQYAYKSKTKNVARICKVCGKAFIVNISMVHKRGDCCSRKCYGKSQYIGLAPRFWEKVNKTGEDDCWNWIGSLTEKGYGRLNGGKEYDYKVIKAPRVAWYLATGAWPHDGLFVLHHCDNPACVNFSHLFLGTNKDNVDDMVAKGRTVAGRKNPPRLTDQQVLAILQKRDAGQTRAEVAAEYSVSTRTIQGIDNGRTRKHLTIST